MHKVPSLNNSLLQYFWRYSWFSILLFKWNYLWHHHSHHHLCNITMWISLKWKKDIPKRKVPFFFTLKSFLNKQSFFYFIGTWSELKHESLPNLRILIGGWNLSLSVRKNITLKRKNIKITTMQKTFRGAKLEVCHQNNKKFHPKWLPCLFDSIANVDQFINCPLKMLQYRQLSWDNQSKVSQWSAC